MMFWKTGKGDNDASRDDETNTKDDSAPNIAQNGTTISSPVHLAGLQNRNVEPTQQQLHTISLMTSPSLSASKKAVHMMNMTSGICADPIHFHSFTTVGSMVGNGWVVPSPKSLFVGAFEKCIVCHGRLGGRATVVQGISTQGESDIIASSGMLHCVACGVYAHRSCAFARQSPSGKKPGNETPTCEVNLIEIQKAFGLSREQMVKHMNVAPQPTMEAAPPSSSWSIFGKRKIDPNDPEVLEEKKEPFVDESKAKSTQQQKPGVLESSIKLIQKTTETTRNIPKASAIGMVAGGAAGLVIAGPAGCVVGSQIGRNALAIGAAIEGGIGVSVLVMSLTAAANFSSSLPSPISSSEKKKELKLNSTLVLVRPDIDVDPIWGEYANEARQIWAEKNKETLSSSCGNFGLGHLFNSNETKRDLRYRKDSDIIKADASELPMREKVFLLVNRILNDKMSLPGYIYRYLILKHKRRTMFGAEWSTDDSEKYSLRASWFGSDKETAGDDMEEESQMRSCRQDAHGVIKHVTATLIEVRPGLAVSTTMTELSASAVEVLVFGELYNDVFGEVIQQTEEKDDSLVSKVRELQKKSNDEGIFHEGTNDVSSVSQSAISALGSLPQAHTPTDKLLHCVEFLECVSEHFSTLFQGKCIDADTLLIMVCQHVVAANIKHLHAEVAFIEEFSRDEQLLSGKEGYALITLQASLHYLDSLDELPDDVSPNYAESGAGGKRDNE